MSLSPHQFEQLTELFKQRAALDSQIELVLGNPSAEPKRRGRPKGYKVNKTKIPKQGKEPIFYECLDCGHTFFSKLHKIDAVCVKCHSLNVDQVKNQ